MNVRKMNLEELELLSFTDIASNLIQLDNEAKATAPLFKEVCSLLGLSENEYEAKIADFFALLTTDKRFVLLNSGLWDLKTHYTVSSDTLERDEDDDEYEDIDDDYELEFEEELEEEDKELEDEYNEIDEEDDEYEDLQIIDEEDSD